MNILDKTFRLLPKSVQVTMLTENFRRVEMKLQYERSIVKYLEEESSEIQSKLHTLGVDL